MNALTFADLKEKLGYYIDGNASNALGYLGDLINDAYLELCNMFRFDFLERTAYLSGVASESISTTVANGVARVSRATTTWDMNDVGRKIVAENQTYKISGIYDGATAIIDRVFEGTTNATWTDRSLFKDTFVLPWGCEYQRIIKISDYNNQQTLTMMPKEKWARKYPNPTASGTPVFWIPGGFGTKRTPTAGLATAIATTNTLQATFTEAYVNDGGDTNYFVNDYFNDWVFTNATRTLISRVTDHSQSVASDLVTHVLTISPAVTAQVATDTIFVSDARPEIILYPMPDTLQSYKLLYAAIPDKLVNNYDVPILPPQWHEAIYLGAALKSTSVLSDNRRTEAKQSFREIIDRMRSEYNFFEDESDGKESIDNECDEAAFSPYNFPLSGE